VPHEWQSTQQLLLLLLSRVLLLVSKLICLSTILGCKGCLS
jgi:hypothetical protein